VSYFLIETPINLKVTGADCVRYLNSRMTNDIAQVTSSNAIIAAILSSDGKTQGLFVIYSVQGDYYLLCDGGDKDEVITALKKFIVAERVSVEDLSEEYLLCHVMTDHAEFLRELGFDQQKELSFVANEKFTAIIRKRSENFGYDIVIKQEQLNSLIADFPQVFAEKISKSDQVLMRIKGNRPVFPDEIGTNRVFLECGLDEAISFTKGCYVGQEVIAKIHSIGKTPRKLSRIVLPGQHVLDAGTKVACQGKPIGEVLSAAFDSNDNNMFCFASLKLREGLTEVEVSDCKGILI